MAVQLSSMVERWFDLFPEARQELALQYFCEVQELYRQRHRRYHTLEHIERMLRALEHYFPEASPAIRQAVWLHDLIYDPRRSDNEECSADSARLLVYELGTPRQQAEAVYNLVLVTKDHLAHSADEQIICDLDLLSLGDRPVTYRRTKELIRQEYGFVPEAQWQLGRGQFIERYLGRDHLYYTPQIYQRCEQQARQNLHAELAELSVAA